MKFTIPKPWRTWTKEERIKEMQDAIDMIELRFSRWDDDPICDEDLKNDLESLNLFRDMIYRIKNGPALSDVAFEEWIVNNNKRYNYKRERDTKNWGPTCICPHKVDMIKYRHRHRIPRTLKEAIDDLHNTR